MGVFTIEGGHKLNGEIIPQGAKNETLQVLCATLLTASKITISNIPDIRDVNILIEIIEKIGVEIEQLEKGTFSFCAKTVDLNYLLTPEYQNLVQSLPHQVDALINEIENLQKNYKLYADALLIQAEQWAHSSLAAYGVGKLEFNSMISAQIRLLRFEIKANKYLFNIYQKRAELEEILGGPIAVQTVRGDTSDSENERTSLKNDQGLIPNFPNRVDEMHREDDGENSLFQKENIS